MCSPKIMQAVRDHVQREGVSRRNFLRLGGAAAAGLAMAGAPGMARPARAQEMSMGEVVDLSHVFSTTGPMFPGFPSPTRETVVTVEANGFYGQLWTLWEHTGTHVDLPGHFAADGERADEYAVANFLGPAVVIDIAERAAEDPDTTVTVEDIEAWEAENGEIPAGAVVFMHSGWAERYSDPAQYQNMDESEVMHFPGFSAEAAAFLVNERDINGVGVDTLSLDPGNSTTFGAHTTFLPAGKFGIENVANLPAIAGKGAMVVVGLPRFEEGSGGPARVIAILPA